MVESRTSELSHWRRCGGVSALAIVLACASTHSVAADADASAAADASGSTLTELVVTAEKRSEDINKVPMAVSAVTASQLINRGYTTFFDINGAVAGMSVDLLAGEPLIAIRGVFTNNPFPGSDPSVATHLNGVYLAHPQDVGGAFYDIDRIEVLKGPQGTLYGREAPGGVVNIITNLPTDKFEASELLTVGNYDAISTRTVLSGPVTSNLFLRVAIATDNHKGYSLNFFNNKYYDDQNAKSGRFTAVFKPLSNLTFTTIADWHREDDGNYATHLGGIVNPAFPLQGVLSGGTSIPLGPDGLAINPRFLDDYVIPTNKREMWGIAEQIVWQLNDVLSLKSITAYRHDTYFYGSDFYGTTWPFPSDYPGFDYAEFGTFHTVSQELNLIGSTKRLNWILGFFFLDDKTDSGGYSFGFAPNPTPFPFTASGTQNKPAYAGFAQGTFMVTNKLGLTAGVRYSIEQETIDAEESSGGVVLGGCVNLPGGFPGGLCHQIDAVTYHAITPRFEAHYQWTDNLMTYASYAEGFKSGGFVVSVLGPPFLPATSKSFEVGVKATSPDGRWAITAAAYDTTYTNMQVLEVTGGIANIINAAGSRIDGFELETTLKPIPELTITDAFGFIDGRYTNFIEPNPNFPFLGPPGLVNNNGHQLQYNSKYTNNIRVNYRLPFFGDHDVELSGEWNWRSKEFFSEFNDPFEVQPAYSLFNVALRYTYPNQKWYVELFMHNIADSLIISQTSIGGCACLNSQYLPPRTFGVNLSYKY